MNITMSKGWAVVIGTASAINTARAINTRWAVLGGWLALCATMPAQAIGINSMLAYTDVQGEAEFVVTNSEDYRQYINVAIAELTVELGQLKKKPYTRDNLSDWALEVHPARTILEPGFKKVFALKYKPRPGVSRLDRDQVFQVSFVPTPYFAEGEKGNAVKMAFGFAPLLIVPAKDAQPLEYEMRYRGDKVTVTNKGNTFFTLYLDGCPKGTASQVQKTCRVDATVLAGRELEVALPPAMQSQPSLRAKMASHGNKFKAEAILSKQP
jgi:P pilus assembly chaperone PapD